MSGSGDPTLPKKNLPDPKLFFSFKYEKNWSDFLLYIQENFKERF